MQKKLSMNADSAALGPDPLGVATNNLENLTEAAFPVNSASGNSGGLLTGPVIGPCSSTGRAHS